MERAAAGTRKGEARLPRRKINVAAESGRRTVQISQEISPVISFSSRLFQQDLQNSVEARTSGLKWGQFEVLNPNRPIFHSTKGFLF
jgi:hypothetical protein